MFVIRTGSANPFDGIDVVDGENPALGDVDGDGTLRPRPSIDKLRSHVLCLSQATWTSSWALVMASSTTSRTPGRLRRRCSCDGPANVVPTCDCIDVGYGTAPALGDLDGDGTLQTVSVDR